MAARWDSEFRGFRRGDLQGFLHLAGHDGPNRQPNPGGSVHLHIAGSHYVVRVTAFELKAWFKFRKAGSHCPEACPFASARTRSMEHDFQSQSCQDLPAREGACLVIPHPQELQTSCWTQGLMGSFNGAS